MKHRNRKMPVTIQTVAEKAGVCPATVSFVLNGRERVASETRREVLRAVSELGYRRRGPGRRRKSSRDPRTTNRTNRLALVVPGLPRSALRAPVYAEVLHGVESKAREAKKILMLCHLPCGEPCPLELFPQKVDGILLFGRVDDAEMADRLRQYPCVEMMGRVEASGLWDHVSYDNRRIGLIAATHLLERGHRRVGVVSSGLQPFFRERGSIFCSTVGDAGGKAEVFADEHLLVDTHGFLEVDRDRMRGLVDRVLALPRQPSALFVTADTLVACLYHELQARGVRPGADIEIISCNNERPLLASLHPRPVTIDIHAESIGRRAVEQLLWRIGHPDAPRVTVALEPTLVNGEIY